MISLLISSDITQAITITDKTLRTMLPSYSIYSCTLRSGSKTTQNKLMQLFLMVTQVMLNTNFTLTIMSDRNLYSSDNKFFSF